jgi:hypothetical protein
MKMPVLPVEAAVHMNDVDIVHPRSLFMIAWATGLLPPYETWRSVASWELCVGASRLILH